MNRVFPEVERRRIYRERRHRRVAYLRKRRPDSLRMQMIATQSAVLDAHEALAATLAPSVHATVARIQLFYEAAEAQR